MFSPVFNVKMQLKVTNFTESPCNATHDTTYSNAFMCRFLFDFLTPNWNEGKPKVTHCIILIQEHLTNDWVRKWDAFMLSTAVKKYYIGLGKDDIIHNDPFLYERFGIPSYAIEAQLAVPLIRINQRGFKALKCPTISGGKWVPYIDDIPVCNEGNAPIVKNQKIFVIGDWSNAMPIEFFVILLLQDLLQYKLTMYHLDEQSKFRGFNSTYIIPLRKYPPKQLVKAPYNEFRELHVWNPQQWIVSLDLFQLYNLAIKLSMIKVT